MKQIAVQVFEKGEPGIFVTTGEDRAKEAFKELERLAKDGQVQIESATIVVKNEEGAVRLKRTSEMTAGKGAGRGAFWGLLVGLIFAGPIGGLLAGLGLGAILGKRASGGIDRDFMKDLGQRIKPGDAALFLLIPGDDEATLKQLEAYAGPLYTTPLTDDVEEALEKATVREDVLEAIKFDQIGQE
jgi:uncharacterized membrane protein